MLFIDTETKRLPELKSKGDSARSSLHPPYINCIGKKFPDKVIANVAVMFLLSVVLAIVTFLLLLSAFMCFLPGTIGVSIPSKFITSVFGILKRSTLETVS